DTLPPPVTSTAAPVQLVPGARAEAGGRGTFQLDFADTDVREVVAQILGTMLGANYTIDPGVHGTVTLRTAQPLTRAELIPALETILAQNGDALIKAGSLYRVTTGSNAGAAVLTTIVLLHYASGEDLAKLLQPYAQNGAKIVANSGSNAVIISGDPMQREALAQLVQAFDVDALAGQSYALLPVENGAASDFATALQGALKSKENAALASVVRVIPMSRIGAVLVVANNPRYVQDAERIYSLVVHNRDATMRSWHVHYLQNGRANDVAFVLQEAF
ncbi:secretin N-terminal domain-containing protein, partial [Acidisphaera rubrifaciens]|uniref:secretin N-terminal domain-containing protein n=1 Tax=Acidisphaera rubrifaciens TaxID=50715 RepID=UPI00066283D7